MMGGSGTRLGADIPKQYIEVGGIPIFSYILSGYTEMSEIDLICVVSHADWINYVRDQISNISYSGKIIIAEGGPTRSESVRNGLLAISPYASNKDVVLIHDATHPYVDHAGTREIISLVQKGYGATLGACQYDTCYQMDKENVIQCVIPRQELVSGASPEAFQYGDISKIYFTATKDELEAMTSAGALALAHKIPMKVVPSQILNLKITYPNDLNLFTLLYKTYFFTKDV